jgi:hypothetical protein
VLTSGHAGNRNLASRRSGETSALGPMDLTSFFRWRRIRARSWIPRSFTTVCATSGQTDALGLTGSSSRVRGWLCTRHPPLPLLPRGSVFVPLWFRSGHFGSGRATTAARAPEQTSRPPMRPAAPSRTFFLRFLAARAAGSLCPPQPRAVRTAPNQWRNPNEHQHHRQRPPHQGPRAS